MKVKKKLAGVQEKHRGFDNDTSGGQSLSRSYGRSNSHHDPVRIQKALLAEIENIEVNHERREVVIKEAEPRWAMQRFRNKTYEKAKFEKVCNYHNWKISFFLILDQFYLQLRRF